MKILALLSFLFIAFLSCKPSNTKEVTSETQIITSHDSSAVVPQPDSLTMDPKTHETAMQQDPPKDETSRPVPVKHCSPNFNLIGHPKKNHHFFYVTGFNPGEFKCWNDLENHGVQQCGGQPCVIYYMDAADVKLTQTAPHYTDPAILQSHGVARFEFNGDWWEVKGSRIWKRTGKGYDYYNTNNHLGG